MSDPIMQAAASVVDAVQSAYPTMPYGLVFTIICTFLLTLIFH